MFKIIFYFYFQCLIKISKLIKIHKMFKIFLFLFYLVFDMFDTPVTTYIYKILKYIYL